jgi:hypothetical protein
MQKYKVRAYLQKWYVVEAENEEDAKNDAMGWLLNDIDKKNVALNDLKASLSYKDQYHKLYKGKVVAK